MGAWDSLNAYFQKEEVIRFFLKDCRSRTERFDPVFVPRVFQFGHFVRVGEVFEVFFLCSGPHFLDTEMVH